MSDKKELFNEQTLGQEIANAITHGFGVLIAIAETIILVIFAVIYKDNWAVIAVSVYGACMTILYLMSTLYHALTNIAAKRIFQVFDHCSIFLLILGTYTPICLIALKDSGGWWLFGVNLVITIFGITLNAINVQKYKNISLVLYLIMGWSVVFAIKPILAVIPMNGLIYFLMGGGLFYSLGVIFYKLKHIRYFHMIWHIFVLAGSILHFFFILLYVIL